jgi:SH3-like domain-containing protein
VGGLVFLRKASALALLVVGFASATVTNPHGAASAVANVTLGPSGLPLPRFVSLKSGRVNARIGPNFSYPVEWLYLKAGLPVEILQEFDTWRKVRDSDGSEGWINQSLLSGRRTGIIAPWQQGKNAQLPLLTKPESKSSSVALVEPGVIGTIRSCDGKWCEMDFSGRSGWIEQNLVWGAYPGELIKD